jgi:AraC-like DNA-binding protein
MAIQTCSLNIKNNKYEKSNRGTPMFPCGAYVTHIGPDFLKEIPWHWHSEVEILIVTKGSFIFRSLNKDTTVKVGDTLFVNTNVLHAGAIINPNEICEIRSFVFDPTFISGSFDSVIEQKYVRPLLETKTLDFFLIKSVADKTNSMYKIVDCTFDIYEKEEFGYEFTIRENLTRIWIQILTDNLQIIQSQKKSMNIETSRVKDMLEFIHDNYMNTIDLDMIANSISVSTRECIRCFKSVIGISPIKYLLNYRISIAASLLINREYSITEICGLCGFESSSYFSYKFKEKTDFTPSEYRKRGIM